MLDLYDAPEPVSFDLIPDDTLAWVKVGVRAVNAAAGVIETVARTGSKFLDVELTIIGGPFNGRKVFDMILTGHPEGRGVQGGQAALKAILEAAGISHPDNKASYRVQSYMAFDGMVAAVKIKLLPPEPYKDQQGNMQSGKAKNRVATWLSPYAASTVKTFNELVQQCGGRPNPPQAQPGGWQAGPPAGHPAAAAPPHPGYGQQSAPAPQKQWGQGQTQAPPQQQNTWTPPTGAPPPGFQPAATAGAPPPNGGQWGGGGPATWPGQ